MEKCGEWLLRARARMEDGSPTRLDRAGEGCAGGRTRCRLQRSVGGVGGVSAVAGTSHKARFPNYQSVNCFRVRAEIQRDATEMCSFETVPFCLTPRSHAVSSSGRERTPRAGLIRSDPDPDSCCPNAEVIYLFGTRVRPTVSQQRIPLYLSFDYNI
jgi:hypothetical protein